MPNFMPAVSWIFVRKKKLCAKKDPFFMHLAMRYFFVFLFFNTTARLLAPPRLCGRSSALTRSDLLKVSDYQEAGSVKSF